MIAQFGFDTLAFVKRLAAAGMDERQAEALAEALTGHAFNEFVTKSDLNSATDALRAEFKAGMKELELRLTIRMGVMNAAIIAILGTLITFN